jgi:hypothetical protein
MRYQTLAETSLLTGTTNEPLATPDVGGDEGMDVRVVVEVDLPGQLAGGEGAVLGDRSPCRRS